MRSTDFCTPKPFHQSTRGSRRFPSAAPFAAAFGVASGRSRPGAFRRRARPRERLDRRPFACCFFSSFPPGFPQGRRRNRASGSSGPPDANEAGEKCASRRASHFGARIFAHRGVVFPPANRSVRLWHSCRLLRLVRCGLASETLTRARRPPRPVPRGPRERRALPRSRVPSIDSRDARPPCRGTARTAKRSLRRGVHVMRTAVPR